MSRRSGATCRDPDESISSFDASSLGSGINVYQTKYEIEHEKARKLEDKLSGYKTVVQQVPKLQETIAALKKSKEEREKEYMINCAEQQRKILYLERALQHVQQGRQGLTDLDVYHPRGVTPSQTHSSPSFEIIEKSTCSTGVEKYVQSLQQPEAASPIRNSNVGIGHSLSNGQRNITLQYQPQSKQILSSPSKDLPQEPVKIEKTNTGGIAGPPRNAIGLLRGFSTNLPTSEHNSHYSALNQLNSFPATKEGVVSVLAFSTGNKKPIWQMELEAAGRKSESSELAQQKPPGSASPTQGVKNWDNSTFPSHNSDHLISTATSHAFMQETALDTGSRLKEWKPLNTLPYQLRATNVIVGCPTSLNTMKPSDHNLAQPENLIPGKISENSGYEFRATNVIVGCPTSLNTMKPIDHNLAQPENLIPGKISENSGYELVSSPEAQSGLTLNLNNLSMSNKMEGNPLETPVLNEAAEPDDLMKFPSLNTNSPVSEQNKTMPTGSSSHIYSQKNGAAKFPNDEQSHFTSQVESMVAILEQNDSPIEMSDMLYKFADNAKNMETKLNEYKALIQQQRVQIQHLQSFSKPNQGEENARLREENSTLKCENETLLDFIGAMNEKKENEIEPGWVSVLAAQNITDPVRAHYPDSPVMKKIESLSNINAKLFRANKDWHNKWEVLRQQTQEEKADLEARVKALETVNKNLQENVNTLEKELQNQNVSLQELTKTNERVEENRLVLQRVNEALNTQLSCLQTEVKDLSRNKQMLETELASIKNLSRSRDIQQAGNRELLAEIGLLKQQLTVFAEDFEKERKDRIIAESKADKFRKERDQVKLSLETKLKKISVQLRAQENDIRAKARQNADLLYQVDDLKLKLQHEQRKSALTHAQNQYSYPLPPASYQGPVSLAYSSGLNGHPTNPGVGGAVSQLFANSNPASVSHMHHSSPEHLPGAWKCRHCTYINYPNRTVCDICGYTNSNAESLPIAESESGRNELQSRGEERRLRDTDDIVVDAEAE